MKITSQCSFKLNVKLNELFQINLVFITYEYFGKQRKTFNNMGKYIYRNIMGKTITNINNICFLFIYFKTMITRSHDLP